MTIPESLQEEVDAARSCFRRDPYPWELMDYAKANPSSALDKRLFISEPLVRKSPASDARGGQP